MTKEQAKNIAMLATGSMILLSPPEFSEIEMKDSDHQKILDAMQKIAHKLLGEMDCVHSTEDAYNKIINASGSDKLNAQ